MYNAQLTIKRIQSLIKEKGYTQKYVLAECGINENTLKRMTDNKGISSFYLAKIADYLQCSVDYLLGRTDNPDGTVNTISQSNIAGNNNASINNASPAPVHDSVTDEFMKIFKELSFEDKAELMHSAVQMKKKEK